MEAASLLPSGRYMYTKRFRSLSDTAKKSSQDQPKAPCPVQTKCHEGSVLSDTLPESWAVFLAHTSKTESAARSKTESTERSTLNGYRERGKRRAKLAAAKMRSDSLVVAVSSTWFSARFLGCRNL